MSDQNRSGPLRTTSGSDCGPALQLWSVPFRTALRSDPAGWVRRSRWKLLIYPATANHSAAHRRPAHSSEPDQNQVLSCWSEQIWLDLLRDRLFQIIPDYYELVTSWGTEVTWFCWTVQPGPAAGFRCSLCPQHDAATARLVFLLRSVLIFLFMQLKVNPVCFRAAVSNVWFRGRLWSSCSLF